MPRSAGWRRLLARCRRNRPRMRQDEFHWPLSTRIHLFFHLHLSVSPRWYTGYLPVPAPVLSMSCHWLSLAFAAEPSAPAQNKLRFKFPDKLSRASLGKRSAFAK
jgi:hypothetical protein